MDDLSYRHFIEAMYQYSTRKSVAEDKLWLFELYRSTLRLPIELTWGWDEAFQQKNFNTYLPPEKFEILMIGGNDIGGFLLEKYADHLWLETLLIHPDYQHRGIGKRVVKQLQRESAANNKVLKLSVIKANPVRKFYAKLGFVVYEIDDAFY